MVRTGWGLLLAVALPVAPAAASARTPIWTIPADELTPTSIAAGPHGRMWVSSNVLSTASSRPLHRQSVRPGRVRRGGTKVSITLR